MEILNYILSGIIVSITPIVFVKILLNCQMNKSKLKVVLIILLSIILNIAMYQFLDGIYKSIFSVTIFILLIRLIYNLSLKKSVLLSIMCFILLILSELILVFIMLVFRLSSDYFYNVFAGSLLANVIIYFSIVPLTFILRKPLKKIFDIKIDANTKIIIFSILTLVSILVFFYDIIASFKVGTKIIFYIIAIATFVIALIIVIVGENKNLKQKIEYDRLIEFTSAYEKELDEEKIKKHEIKNQFLTVRSKIKDGDKKENIISYIDSIVDNELKEDENQLTKFQFLPPNGLKALLYFKVAYAKNLGIRTDINVNESVKNSQIDSLTTTEFKQLGSIIGVYLDNAIEASLNSDKKYVGIEIYATLEDTSIIISNSYVGNIMQDKVGSVHYSTKGKGHGYGLMLVKNILNSSDIFATRREITPSMYIQTLIVKNKGS